MVFCLRCALWGVAFNLALVPFWDCTSGAFLPGFATAGAVILVNYRISTRLRLLMLGVASWGLAVVVTILWIALWDQWLFTLDGSETSETLRRSDWAFWVENFGPLVAASVVVPLVLLYLGLIPKAAGLTPKSKGPPIAPLGETKSMDRMMHRALLLLLGVWFLSAGPAVHAAESILATTFQETVDRMQRLKPDERDIPAHFMDGHLEAMMRGGEFDVQEYFSVLKHISIEEGYTLDYVYRYGDGRNAMLANKMLGTVWLYPPGQGRPILYARETQEARLLTYSELLLMVWGKARLGEAVQIVRESEDTNRPHDASLQKRLADISRNDFKKFYLEHVRTDGSREGWLELTALYLLGDQFYLFWHANYNDAQIVATSAAALGNLRGLSDKDFACDLMTNGVVDRTARSKNDFAQHRRAFQDKAAALDLEPVVWVADRTVMVSLVTFSKWGGFVRRTFEVSRSWPHTINERDRKVLLSYECGMLF